ncbi:MAG: 3-oxoacyl-ACP synthase III family protein [Thermoguttaceae bacterium]
MKLAQICDISCYVPEHALNNEELAKDFPNWSQERTLSRLGIEKRPIAAPDETALDMGVAACQNLFQRGTCSPNEIDFIILCTQSPDYFLPTSACIMQEKLALPKSCGALDFNLGCSGYVYGLALCKGLIEANLAKNVLLVTSETYTKYINQYDRTNRPLFGDGATATLIKAVEPPQSSPETSTDPFIGPFVFGTDGSGADMLIVPAGAHRLPCSTETKVEKQDSKGSIRSQEQLYMHGSGIFAFAIDTVPPTVEQLLKQSGKTREDIDCFVFHQANLFLLERLRELCKIDTKRYFNDVLTRGNTVSSSIPIAMIDAFKCGMLKPGDLVMLVGFGVGLSWGGTLVKLPDNLNLQ